MSEPIRCEQVVIAWSPSNLHGHSGMGPVAASAGWELVARDPFAGLGDGARYVSEDMGEALAAAPSSPPVALEYRPGPTTTLLIAKTYDDRSHRAGHYRVHALRGPAERLAPQDLWAARTSGALLTAEPAEPLPLTLPVVELAPAARRRARQVGAGVLELFLQRLYEGRVLTIRTTRPSAGEVLIQSLVAALPPAIARGLFVSTFLGAPTRPGPGLGLVIPPFSQGFTRVDVDVDAEEILTPDGSAAEISAALAGAKAAEVAPLTTLAELRAWAELRAASPAALPVSRLRDAAGPALFATLLERLASDPERGTTVLRVMDDPVARERFAASLSEQGGRHGAHVALLLDASRHVERRRNAELQDWIVSALGERTFTRQVAGPLQAVAAARPVDVDGVELAEAVESALGARAELADFRFRTTTRAWSSVTDLLVEEYLLDPEHPQPPARVWEQIDREPRRLASAIEAVAGQAKRRSDAVGVLPLWPERHLPALMEAIVTSKRIPADWAPRALEGRTPEVVADALERWWPQMATRLGIPASVLAQLKVRRPGLFDRWR